jgi:hypothetical protein
MSIERYLVSTRDFHLLIRLAGLAGGSREPNESSTALAQMRAFIDKLKSGAVHSTVVPEGIIPDNIPAVCSTHGLVEYLFDERDQIFGSLECLHCHRGASRGTRVLQPDLQNFGTFWKARGGRGWTHLGCCQYWLQWGVAEPDVDECPF